MKPTNEDTVEISRALALWAHIMDDHELDRLGECLTEDAVWDGSVFGFDPVVGLDAIATFLNVPGHAKSHHTTNNVVSEGPGDEVRARSKGLSLLEGGGVAGVVGGWRVVLDVARPDEPVDDPGVAPLEHALEDVDDYGFLVGPLRGDQPDQALPPALKLCAPSTFSSASASASREPGGAL